MHEVSEAVEALRERRERLAGLLVDIIPSPREDEDAFSLEKPRSRPSSLQGNRDNSQETSHTLSDPDNNIGCFPVVNGGHLCKLSIREPFRRATGSDTRTIRSGSDLLLRDEAFERHVAAPRDAERQGQRRLPSTPLDHREERHRTADVLRDLHQRLVRFLEERLKVCVDPLWHPPIIHKRVMNCKLIR